MDLKSITADQIANRLGQPSAELELEILRWLGEGRVLNGEELYAVNWIAQGVREHVVRVRWAWAGLRAVGLVQGTPQGYRTLWTPNLSPLLEAA